MLVSVLYIFFSFIVFMTFQIYIISTIIFYGPPYKTLSCCFFHYHKHWKEPSKTTTSSSNGISFFSNNNIFDMMESRANAKVRKEEEKKTLDAKWLATYIALFKFFSSLYGGWAKCFILRRIITKHEYMTSSSKLHYIVLHVKMQI